MHCKLLHKMEAVSSVIQAFHYVAVRWGLDIGDQNLKELY
jgi:hypothetical protein